MKGTVRPGLVIGTPPKQVHIMPGQEVRLDYPDYQSKGLVTKDHIEWANGHKTPLFKLVGMRLEILKGGVYTPAQQFTLYGQAVAIYPDPVQTQPEVV